MALTPSRPRRTIIDRLAPKDVRRVRAVYRDNGSWTVTARVLNDEGLRLPNGGLWKEADVKRVISLAAQRKNWLP